VKKLCHTGRVHGNKTVDMFLFRREQIFSAAQVTVAFFSHASDEEQISFGSDIGILKGTQYFQHNS
jgi:uncharacterized protein YcsI (UPF0317 family)